MKDFLYLKEIRELIRREKMKVLGITTTQEVYIGSKEKNFRNNEFLVVEDPVQGELLGEIVEAKTYNRFIPLDMEGDFVDSKVLSSLKSMGYDINEETIYIGKLRFFEEVLYAPITGSDVRIPTFAEIKEILLNIPTKEAMILGIIKNTDDLARNADEDYKNLCHTFEKGEYKVQVDLPYLFDYRSMHQYPHIGIFGGSGSGKSFGMRVLLEEIMEKEIPTIVLDPHFEMDFSNNSPISQKSYKDKFKCLQIGIDVGIKFQDLNKGDLKNLLNSVSELTDSMNNVIDVILIKGASYVSFKNKLDMLLEAYEYGSREKIISVIDQTGDLTESQRLEKVLEVYEKFGKITNAMSVRGVLWRLNSLYNEGIFSYNVDEVFDLLKRGKLVVLQGSTRLINVFSTYILTKLYNLRKDYRDEVYRENLDAEFFPPFIVVTDEAHNFAPKGYNTASKSIIREISQEGRKYGVFLILATQRPTLLDETITAQLNTKMIFRTVRASDIDTIKEETDLRSEESNRLPYLKTGDVFISSSERGRSSFVRIRASNTLSPHSLNPFDELKENTENNLKEFLSYIYDFLPLATSSILVSMTEINKKFGTNYSYDEFLKNLEALCENNLIAKNKDFLGESYKRIEED